MIIQEINATVNGNSLSGEVIVPSPVLTATKQAEDGDLTKSPNFQIKLTGVTPEMNIIDTVQVEFTNGDFNYTANMNVINKLQNGTVTLQYVDGLTVEEADDSSYDDSSYDDSSDDDSSDDLEPETYYIYAGNITHATVTYDENELTEGETTTFTVTPDSGYVLNTLVVEGDSTGNTISTTDLGNNEYSFIMPAEDVNIHVDCIIDDDSSDDDSSDDLDEPTFTYDGYDQSRPIQVNVDLSAFDSSDVRIYPNLSAPEGIQYDWVTQITWTPDTCTNFYSDDNDFPIMGMFEGGGDFSPVDDFDMNDNKIWKDGPTTAGTYLKSYTCTFVYNKDYSQIYDETTNDKLDDPVAQALDGTVVTFWVEYTVTGAYPEPEFP